MIGQMISLAFALLGAAAVYGTCEGQQRVFTVQVFMKS